MSNVLDKYDNKNIDKKYIDENIQEILNNLVKIFPDESHKKPNWKRSLNQQMSGFNILSAVIHKICKNTEKMFSRIDIFHEKEVALEESIQRNYDAYKRHQESSDQFREIQYIMIKKLKSKLSLDEYEEFVNDDLSSFNRGYFGF